MDDERVEVCACVLAAGESRRMGQPKLLKPFAGSTLLERAVGAARGSGCDRTVVVTGAYHEAMAPLLARWGVDFVRNRSWARGQASSVRCAVGYARRQGFDAVLLLVADQPFVTSRELDALRCAHAGGEGVAYVSAVGSRKGNPCLFGEACYEGLSALRGDEGARALFRSDPEMSVTPVRFDDPRLFDDVDTPEEFSRHEAAVMRWERELAAEGWKGEPR